MTRARDFWLRTGVHLYARVPPSCLNIQLLLVRFGSLTWFRRKLERLDKLMVSLEHPINAANHLRGARDEGACKKDCIENIDVRQIRSPRLCPVNNVELSRSTSSASRYSAGT